MAGNRSLTPRGKNIAGTALIATALCIAGANAAYGRVLLTCRDSTVSIDANNVFTVVGGEGSVAVGGQGEGEVISFIASAPTFGNFGTTAPYTCATALATVGYLDAGTDKARVTMTYEFTDCAQAGSDDLISCGVIYYGEADKVG